MYKLIKPLLFKIEPEKAHGLTIDALKIAQKQSYVLPIMKKLFDYQNPMLSQDIHGITFENQSALQLVMINLVKYLKL